MSFDTEQSYNEERDAYIARIEAEGFKVVFPKDSELFIDIDTNEQYQIFKRQFDLLWNSGIYLNKVYDKPSKSGPPHRHIIVSVGAPINDKERILFQSLLCSDPVRDALSYIRWVNGIENPILFVEKKDESGNERQDS